METSCRLCQANGLKKQLVLFQLNLEEAILLCENKECLYPLGASDEYAELIVRRQASEISTLKRKRKKKQKQREIEASENGVGATRCLETYLQWQNVDSLCWLDSVLSLVVHNVTMCNGAASLAVNVDSLLRMVIKSFNQAQDLSSINREQAVKCLQDSREKVWRYLQPQMKCQYGVNDSPVTALLLLLRENCTLSETALQVYQWEFSCTACGYQQIDKRRKHLVTFPNVTDDFSLKDPAFMRPCYRCGALNQRSKLVYDKMPQCILLHFEEGLQAFEDLSFKGENGHYVVTQFIQYKHSPDHFICWTKEPKGRRWMEMDDLKSPLCGWRPLLPPIPPSEVHIVAWEKVDADLVSSSSLGAMKATTNNPQEKPGKHIKVDCSEAKVSPRPLLSIDINLKTTSSGDISKALLSPTLASPLSLPPVASRSRTLQGVQHKLGARNFEPYIPRKKRLSYSCPNSPLGTKPDVDKGLSPLLSRPLLSQPFLTWQDIKEQTKKISTDDLQSDSGYSSPPSVSSCSSLPVSQSSTETSVSDCLEDFHTNHEAENHDPDKAIGNSIEDSLSCDHSGLSPNVFSSHKAKFDIQGEARHEDSPCGLSHSIELANKLEELLPDCLLDNSKDSACRDSAKKLKLGEVERLSDEQEQFIRDLLAT